MKNKLQVMQAKNEIRKKIEEHMRADPAKLVIVNVPFEPYVHASVNKALELYLNEQGWKYELTGISGPGDSMANLIRKSPRTMARMPANVSVGPIEYLTLPVGPDATVSCVERGLFLAARKKERMAIFVKANAGSQYDSDFGVDVLASSKESAEDFVRALKARARIENVFRGKVLSLDRSQPFGIKFNARGVPRREDIVLPDELLARIERQTVAAEQYSRQLLKAGRKLKRGILLHGKPGTGKTLTAMYLAAAMSGRTVLHVTGAALENIEECCRIARWLEPAMIIVEDVDLIAQERSMNSTNGLLCALLNEMDGLASDADILFLLTTNRPEVLEPALASRPGRIDQAYEIPLPNEQCRRRLFELYGRGLKVEVRDTTALIRRTEGATGALIAELLRKAALFAAPESDPIVVRDEHFEEAFHEMLVAGGSVTKTLFGAKEIGFCAQRDAGLVAL